MVFERTIGVAYRLLVLAASITAFSCTNEALTSDDSMDSVSLFFYSSILDGDSSWYNLSGVTAGFVAPENFSVDSSTGGSVVLNWKFVGEAGYYILYRSTSSTMTTESSYKIATIDKKTNSYTDTSVIDGKLYYYTLVAARVVTDSAGNTSEELSAYAGPLSVTPSAKDESTKPSTPTGLSTSSIYSAVTLSWTGVSGATGYRIYRSTNSGMQAELDYLLTTVTTNSYTDSTAAIGTTYYYTVEAYNDSGTSGYVGPTSGAAAADTTSPSIQSFSISTSTGTPGTVITFTAAASDTESGIQSVTAALLDGSGSSAGTVTLSYNSSSGNYEGTYTVGSYDTAGTYTVSPVTATDNSGNTAVLTTSTASYYILSGTSITTDITSMAVATFTISGTLVDSTPPVINSIYALSSSIVSSGTVEIQASVTDSETSVATVTVTFYCPDYFNGTTTTKTTTLTSNGSDIWTGTFSFDSSSDITGTWQVGAIQVIDAKGNYRDFTIVSVGDTVYTESINGSSETATTTISIVTVALYGG